MLERTLSPEEKIKRAEEIYARRRGGDRGKILLLLIFQRKKIMVCLRK